MMPYERDWQTPPLVSLVDQLQNTAELVHALGNLLYEGREAAINQAP
jgi:hypothetical protein